MFSWLIDLSKQAVDVEAIWLVVLSAGTRSGRTWAALVSAFRYSHGDFTFELDPDVGRTGETVLLRYRNDKLNRMETRPATVISRAERAGELSSVRVLVDECACGAADCEAAVCYEAGRFVRREPEWRAAA